MSTDAADDERTQWSPWAIAAAILLLLIFGVIAFGTVRGCFFVDPQEAAKTDEEKKKKKDEEEKKELQITPPIVMPAEPKTPLPLIKPGHWETISQDMRMNYRDFVGDSRAWIGDAQERPYPIASTQFNVRASRPVLLSKGRWKSTETTLFMPEATQALSLWTELEDRGLGFGTPRIRTPLTPMPSYQYHFVVLAKDPSRYAYIKTIDSVKAPYGGESESDELSDSSLLYSVVMLAAGQTVALPDNPLTWTSTAYMLWDEVDPGDPITPDQEKAIVDWVHWGGQLIISGPDSLDLLKGSFLEPYLPAASGGPIKFGADDPAIAELNKHWMVSTDKTPGEPLKLNAPWSGVKLNLVPNTDATAIPNTGGLFVERPVGRGRIVVSAMQLNERDLINWRSGFESLFNGCLMRRPARTYIPGYYGPLTITWAADSLRERRLDAAVNTRLRFFARDAGVETSYHWEDVTDEVGYSQFNRFGQPTAFKQYKPPTSPGGIGAWSDFSATANAARGALREAAGVEVPGADFVVLCLAAYLVALVPINWIVFRTIGRVEWAWIAAPIIAFIGTWVIVQRAQLDIGFVRAQTEIGILEQQPDHPRAHLSRYTALYTSLSTTYDIQSDNTTTLAAPFPNREDFQMLIGQSLTPVNFQRYDNVRLVGLPISSNSTGMVHSEQMHTLDGPIRLGTSTALGSPQIENRTKQLLRSVCIVRKPTFAEANSKNKSKRRTFEGRWIGDLLPGQSAPTAKRMSDLSDKKPFFADERAKEASTIRTPRLNLEPMFQLALDPRFIEEGETRLVARIDEVLPGEEITPAASQVRGATLVVAHLQYASPPPPEKDANTRRDIKETDDILGAEAIEL